MANNSSSSLASLLQLEKKNLGDSKDSCGGQPPSAVRRRVATDAFVRPATPSGPSSAQQPGSVLRVVGKNNASARAPDADERFHHHAFTLNPAILRRRFNHGVLA
jgi:hypothetical protein